LYARGALRRAYIGAHLALGARLALLRTCLLSRTRLPLWAHRLPLRPDLPALRTRKSTAFCVLKRAFLPAIVLRSFCGHGNRKQKGNTKCQNRLHNDLPSGHTPSKGEIPKFMPQQSANLANAPIAGAWSYSSCAKKRALASVHFRTVVLFFIVQNSVNPRKANPMPGCSASSALFRNVDLGIVSGTSGGGKCLVKRISGRAHGSNRITFARFVECLA
jgi:hypothetical protein